MPQKNYNPSKSLSEDLCNLIAFAEANNLFQFTGKDSSYFKGILEEFDNAKAENANRKRLLLESKIKMKEAKIKAYTEYSSLFKVLNAHYGNVEQYSAVLDTFKRRNKKRKQAITLGTTDATSINA